MMKPATIVILAAMALVASACTATPGAHTAAPGAQTASPGGRTGRAATPAASLPASPGSGGDGPSTLLLGHLIMRAPASWRVTYSDPQGDYAVSTGSCDDDALLGSMAGSRCPSFSMIVGAGPVAGAPAVQSYRREDPYDPSSGILGCPGQPAAGWKRLGPSNAYREGFAHVSSGTAYYTVWTIGCGAASADGPATAVFYFQQRDWYLPGSQILIVDEYPIPGLATVLADAGWRLPPVGGEAAEARLRPGRGP
jgi:hypothetical protein